MKRTVFFAAIFGSFTLATAASAGNEVEVTTNPMVGIAVEDILDDDNDRPSRKRKFGRLGKIGQLVEKFTKDDDNEQNPPVVPIDPGMGNGQPTAPPAPPVPTRPGYVWVGDHWEREKAPQNNVQPPAVVNPLPVGPIRPVARPGYVWVGDHWERVKAPQQPLMIVDPIPVKPVAPQGRPGYVWVGDHWERVKAQPSHNAPPRDPRKPVTPWNYPQYGQGTSSATSGPIIRDHRTPAARITVDSSRAPGGVTVTSTPRPTRRPSGSNAITSSSPLDGVFDAVGNVGGLLGDTLGAAGNAVGIGHGSITPVGPAAPAKPAYKAPPGATVRDHR
ncbi:MAG: hypothetical protein WD851_22675 [Pirellulales bacterium]